MVARAGPVKRLAENRDFAHKRGMPRRDVSLAELIADGRWLAHRYDETTDSIHFRHVDRAAHEAATFLTDAELGEGPAIIHPRQACLAEARSSQPPTPRFILHSAYCCSTLLARAFDIPGSTLGIKEPVILNDAVGLQLRRADPRQVAAALDAALLLLARPLATGEVNVIKPSNVFNPMLPALVAMRPDARLLLLHAPLEAFLGSVARKEVEGRAWVRELMWKLIRLGQVERFGFSEEDLYRQTDLQVAALGWLAQQAAFSDAAKAHSEAVRTLSSETLVEEPAAVMAALAEHFAVSLDAEGIAAGRAFSRHSKWGDRFSAEDRERERIQGLELHAREIAMVMEWSRRVADHARVPMALPAPLLP